MLAPRTGSGGYRTRLSRMWNPITPNYLIDLFVVYLSRGVEGRGRGGRKGGGGW